MREYEAYKSVYCGLCKQLGKDYSVFSRFILSYDCTFYAVFLLSLKRSCTGFKDGRCRFNPFKKCKFCQCGGDALSKAAALSVILSFYKLEDNISDSGFLGRLGCKIFRPFFSRNRKKAAQRYPEIDEYAAEMMRAQLEAERAPGCGIDMAADPTALMLAKVFSLEAENDSQKRIYYQIGYGLGRFIYLIDAADDYNDDLKSGSFNPFKNTDQDKYELMNNNLSQALAVIFDAYNLLELVDFKGIIDNVILRGLPSVQAEITRKVKINNEKSV